MNILIYCILTRFKITEYFKKRCIEQWKKFSRSEILKKKAEEEKAKTKNRMQKFLEAAADGKLWSKEDETGTTDRENSVQFTKRSVSSNKPKNKLMRSKSFEGKFLIQSENSLILNNI